MCSPGLAADDSEEPWAEELRAEDQLAVQEDQLAAHEDQLSGEDWLEAMYELAAEERLAAEKRLPAEQPLAAKDELVAELPAEEKKADEAEVNNIVLKA